MRYILLFTLILLASCTKTKCYKCTTYRGGSMVSPTSSSVQVCDMTKDQARDYEQKNTSAQSGPGPSAYATTYCE